MKLKSYTDLSQSKTLSKFLPLDSADYTRLGKDEDNVLTRSYFESCSSELKEWIDKDEIYPCWSLAALLDVLPTGKVLLHDKSSHGYKCSYKDIDTNLYNNPVDACYEMILKLHELNLL